MVNLTKKFIKKYIYVVLYFAKECFPPSQMTNVGLLAAKLCMASVLLWLEIPQMHTPHSVSSLWEKTWSLLTWTFLTSILLSHIKLFSSSSYFISIGLLAAASSWKKEKKLSSMMDLIFWPLSISYNLRASVSFQCQKFVFHKMFQGEMLHQNLLLIIGVFYNIGIRKAKDAFFPPLCFHF